MPSYRRFEDLPVWQEAVKLYEAVDRLSGGVRRRLSHSFGDQLERAALSISNNIAEGFERGTTAELLTFVYIARGSAGEVRSMLCLLERREGMADRREQIAQSKGVAESCSRQLSGWAQALQDSENRGQRYQTQAARQEQDQRRRAQQTAELLLKQLPPDHPLRRNKSGAGTDPALPSVL